MSVLKVKLLSVQTPLGQLLPIGFFASFGAPLLYLLMILFKSLGASSSLSFTTVGIAVLSALFFSWIVNMAFVLITCLIALMMRRKTVNVIVLSMFYLLGIFLVSWRNFEVIPSLLLVGLSLANALIFMFLAIIRTKIN